MKLLGWLTRERRVGERRAPSVLDWLVAFALMVIALIEIAGGVFPGPVKDGRQHLEQAIFADELSAESLVETRPVQANGSWSEARRRAPGSPPPHPHLVPDEPPGPAADPPFDPP